VPNHWQVTKTNTIDEMPGGDGTLKTTAVKSCHQVSHRVAKMSQLLQNLTTLLVTYYSMLNAPPELQVLSEAPVNGIAESESTLLSSMGAREHLEVL
jgi:hypothetical protein